jgi:hypothetical protein
MAEVRNMTEKIDPEPGPAMFQQHRAAGSFQPIRTLQEGSRT